MMIERQAAFDAQVKALKSRAAGNAPLVALIGQMGATGCAATLQTLASASSAQIELVAAAVASYQPTGGME